MVLFWSLSGALTLVACGGGGGGGSSDVPPTSGRAGLPELSQDTFPSGDRISIAGRDFFAFTPGDRAIYNSSDLSDQLVRVQREVIEGPDALGRVAVRETPLARPEFSASTERFQVRPDGLYQLDFWGPDAPSGLRSRVGDLLLVPTPLYPVGSMRSVVRQGDLGADLDGDQVSESFRFEFEQRFVGFEVGQRGGRSEQRLRFENRLLLRIQLTRLGVLPIETPYAIQQVFAERVGLIENTVRSTSTTSIPSRYNGSGRVVEGVLGGRSVDLAWNTGSARHLRLQHMDLVYSARDNAYYAGSRVGDSQHPGRVVRIDATTGAMTASPDLGNDVVSLALAANGQSIYAGVLNRGSIFRLSLPDLRIVQTIELPSRTAWAFNIAASPVDSETIAFHLGNVWQAALIARNGVTLPRGPDVMGLSASSGQKSAFTADGTAWLTFGRPGLGGEHTGLRVPLVADGLAAVASPLPIIESEIRPGPSGLVIGRRLHRPDTLEVIAEADVPDSSRCASLSSGAKWACWQPHSAQNLGIIVVDAARMAPIPDGQIVVPSSPQIADSCCRPTRVVPGPRGQLALTASPPGIQTHGEWVVILDNPDFQ